MAVACTAQRRDARSSGAASTPPDDPESVASLCQDLDSPDLQKRLTASRELQIRAGATEGGTEQQMEAAAALCARVSGKNPSSMPTQERSDVTGAVQAACPPLGTWKLRAAVQPCTGIDRFDIEVTAGPPSGKPPVLPPALPAVASGRTNTGQPYETLLMVTDPQSTAAGCMVQLHLEYLGPHEMLTYDARVQIEGGRLKGKGRFDYEADDCKKPDPDECSCLSEVNLTGEVGVSR